MRGCVGAGVCGCVGLPGCGGPKVLKLGGGLGWWVYKVGLGRGTGWGYWMVGLRSGTGKGDWVVVLGGGSKKLDWERACVVLLSLRWVDLDWPLSDQSPQLCGKIIRSSDLFV